MSMSHKVVRSIIFTATLVGLATPALAHHSFGEFQMDMPLKLTGTLTDMHFVNPHSYMEIDAVDANGKKVHMRCEMRAATLLKRSGWSAEMFKVGSRVEVEGHPHRTDPHACYIENLKIGDAPTLNRNDQFESKTKVDTSKRQARLADGQPNISGDWAVEQLVLTVPPSGGNGSMIPKSMSTAFAAGKITLQEVQATQPPRPRVVYTAEGKKAADAFKARSPKDNPWFACKPTSFIRDWTADWPINRFEQKTRRTARRSSISPTVCTTSNAVSTSAWPSIRTVSSRATPAIRLATGKATHSLSTPWGLPLACCRHPRAAASRCISSSASRSIRRSFRCGATIP